MKELFTGIMILTSVKISWAQPADSLWSRMYGGTGVDLCNAVKQTDDGGFICAGKTNYSANDVDAWIVKTDASGNSQWTRMLGGIGTEVAWDAVIQTQGGFAMVGTTNSFGAGHDDIYFATFSPQGIPQNISYWGGALDDWGLSLVQTSEGGFATGGVTKSFGAGNSDFWLVKCDALGAYQWDRTYGGTSFDEAYAVRQTEDGGYAIAGFTTSFGAGLADAWLVKTNSTGQMLWNRTYGYAGEDVAYDMITTSDGGYALAGYTQNDGGGEFDVYVVKTDGNGTTQWVRSFGGQYDDVCYSIRQTSDGGYIISGRSESYGSGADDFWIMRLSSTGSSLWNRTFGGSNSDVCSSVAITADGGFVLGGRTMSFGAVNWDIWLVRTGTDPVLGAVAMHSSAAEFLLHPIYPNPFNNRASISFDLPREVTGRLVVYDMLGRQICEICHGRLTAGTHRISFDGSSLSSGTYVVQLATPEYNATKKVVLVK